MYLTVTIKKYPVWCIPFAVLSMVLFRLPLSRQKEKLFFKLMGSAVAGDFRFLPDLRQWVILYFSADDPVNDHAHLSTEDVNRLLYGRFIARWIRIFHIETLTLSFAIISGHGSWDGFRTIRSLNAGCGSEESISVLTRATLKWTKVFRFWRSAHTANRAVQQSHGLLFALGSGEIPFFRNVTLSIWKNQEAMKSFAYSNASHVEIMQKARHEKWYTEELFLRLKLMAVYGKQEAIKPLQALNLHTQMS